MLFKYMISRSIRQKLERLDDRLLHDIGLDRGEIDRVAKGSVPAQREKRYVHFF